MARKTAAEAAKTRQRILDAAAEVFASQGFPDTTLDQIARQRTRSSRQRSGKKL